MIEKEHEEQNKDTLDSHSDSDFDSEYEYNDSDEENGDFDFIENYEKLERKAIYKNSDNIVWIKQIFKWINTNKNNQKFSVIWDEENPLQCTIVLTRIGTFNLKVSDKEPFFPCSPPLLSWSEPNLNFIDSLSLKYIECLKDENWNICQNLDDVIEKIYNYVSKIKKEERPYNKTLINYLYTISEISGIYPSTILSDLPKFGTLYINKNTESKNYHGTGYSQGNIEKWDVSTWNKKKDDTIDILSNIYSFIIENKLSECDIENFRFSALVPFLNRLIKNTSLQEISKEPEKYLIIFKIGRWIYKNEGINELHKSLLDITKDIEFISEKAGKEIITEKENEILSLVKDYDLQDIKITNENCNDNYINVMGKYHCCLSEELKFHSYKEKNCNLINAGKWCRRLFNEWKDFSKSLPLHKDGSVFIRWYSEDGYSHLFKILIIPPLSTPYGGGCYEFDMFIPPDYPITPPQMKFLTTGGGTVRFNPNLYKCGKICLSLLGTWSGEKWNPEISNIYQICVSILALIFVDEPYFNEPGYQNSIGTKEGITASKKYNDNIKIQNIKYAIINMIKNPPEDFKEVITNHYKIRIEEIKDNILKWIAESNNPKSLKMLLKQLNEIEI